MGIQAAAKAPAKGLAKSLDRKDLTGPALRTFFRIADAWGLKEQEQMRLLGLESRSTFQSWKRGVVAALPKDALERISYVMGIYQGLHRGLQVVEGDVDIHPFDFGAFDFHSQGLQQRFMCLK